ncbi:GNAT family N-acetyltransferase [Janthinobacterium sp. Mn2066]|uniref:GNAT family N-acetyltransferase n=1 Tax=Janthinobacterium sp. Mn2066 TaxID=3395264 RepID=UPI003BEBCEBD
MTTVSPIHIHSCTVPEIERQLPQLAQLLLACVHDGASIGFILPFKEPESTAFWTQNVLPAVQGGRRLLLVAEQEGQIVGAVQLDWDSPANQQHRAEVRKLMVDPAFRRRGIARLLMQAVEARARQLPRSLLTLDTRTHDHAEPLYISLGYTVAGVIPGYALSADHSGLDATTILYKQL